MTDILNARRNGSDICWILKDYESKLSYFNNYKTKEIIRKSLLDSLEFKYDIKMLSDKMGKSEVDLLKEAENILSSMSHNIGMNSIRFMGVTLSKIMKRLYTHVHVNDCGIAKLREAYKDSNVVLLPTHRSYADFLLVSYVMFTYNLPMPVIAAAMDFMNMKFIGELLRSCGAFFIRRSFVDDDLYWTVFSHYIKTLIKISQESLEFFIEGTRSRTNKSLYPKIGMLGIILEMWLSSSCDIKIIPIGISYDRLLEEKLYAWELFGVPKPKESTSGLLKVRHILKENFGNVYFNVGDPISISELAHQFGVKRMDHNLELRFRPSLFESEKKFLRQLSKIIVDRQQHNFVISDWSVIVLILTNHGSRNSCALSMDELCGMFSDLAQLLVTVGAKLALDIDNNGGGGGTISRESRVRQHIMDSLEVHGGLIECDDGGVRLLSCRGLNSTVEDIDQNNVDQILVDMYRNPLLFHLAKESLLLNRIKFGTTIDGPSILNDFKCALDLLSRELIYADCPQQHFDVSVTNLRRCKLLVGHWTVNEEHPCVEMILGLVRLHLVAYIVYGHVFLADIVPQIASLKLPDQVKLMQREAIKWCRVPDSVGNGYLEICSLDIARNALTQLTEIYKRESRDGVKRMVDGLGNFLCKEISGRVAMALSALTK